MAKKYLSFLTPDLQSVRQNHKKAKQRKKFQKKVYNKMKNSYAIKIYLGDTF